MTDPNPTDRIIHQGMALVRAIEPSGRSERCPGRGRHLPHDLSDEGIFEQLLALNLERAKE
jgi:hypothetical protein